MVELRLNHFDLEAVSIDGAAWTEVALGKLPLRLEAGLPALPTLRESIVIPDDGEMGLRVLGAEYTDLAGHRRGAVQGQPDRATSIRRS